MIINLCPFHSIISSAAPFELLTKLIFILLLSLYFFLHTAISRCVTSGRQSHPLVTENPDESGISVLIQPEWVWVINFTVLTFTVQGCYPISINLFIEETSPSCLLLHKRSLAIFFTFRLNFVAENWNFLQTRSIKGEPQANLTGYLICCL